MDTKHDQLLEVFINTGFGLWRDLQPNYKAYYDQIDHFTSSNLEVDNEAIGC